MAGNAKPGEQDRPQQEEVESTVAMESPGVTPGVPLPISNPPPAMGAKPADVSAKSSPGPGPGPGPAPAAAPSPGAAAAPRAPVGRPLGPPGIPGSTRTPSVAGRIPLPSAGVAGAAKPPGAPLGPPGVSAKRTVMGLAPPANAASKAAGPSPLQPAPMKSPGLPVRGAPSPAAPAAPAPSPIAPPSGIPKLHDDDDEPPDDGPTMASDLSAFAATAQSMTNDMLPPPKAEPAAPPPAAVGGTPSLHSPMSTTGYTGSPPQQEEENEAATVTVPKDVLDRVRADPKAVLAESKAKAPVPAAGRPYSDVDDSAEPTKAVPREELLRGTSQGHVVIGADAGGEDATLAVPPSANEASGMNLQAAIGDALQQGGMPSPLGDQGFPPPQGHPYQSYQGMGPPSGQNPVGPHGPYGQPGMGMQGHPPQNQPWSSGHLPAANPRTPGGVQSYPGGPMMMNQATMQSPGGIPRTQAPTNWSPLQAPQPKSKISGQMILLFVVGFVCLAIFVTGIVLFATTKF